MQRPRVAKRQLLHLVVSGQQARTSELLLEEGPAHLEPIFRGLTGPQGVDGE